MADCCSENGCGCGCSATTIYTDKECPNCSRKLRMTGSLQTVKLYLTCPECGYQSSELTINELHALI